MCLRRAGRVLAAVGCAAVGVGLTGPPARAEAGAETAGAETAGAETAGAETNEQLAPSTAGEDRLPRLVQALRTSSSFKVRATAAVALGRLGDRRAAPALIDAASDDHYAVRVAVVSALGRLPTTEGVPTLLAALYDRDPFVRDEANAALDRFHTPAHVIAFRDALNARDPVLRLAAVRAYGAVLREDPGLAPLVLAALADDVPAVAQAARSAVDGVPHDRAIPLLVAALADGGSIVKAGAAQLLTKRTDPRAVEPLVTVLMSPDEGEDVRRSAAEALAAHRDHLDATVLRAAATRPGPARVRALRVLAVLERDKAWDVVEKALRDGDGAIRLAAARAAADIGGPKARVALQDAQAREKDARAKKQLELLHRGLR